MKKRKVKVGKKKNFIGLFFKVFFGVITIGTIALTAFYALKPQKEAQQAAPDNIENVVLEGLNQELLPEQRAEDDSEKYAAVLSDETFQKQEWIYPKQGSKEGTATMAFAGDVMFDDSYSIMTHYRNQEKGVEGCFGEDLLAEMRAADIFMLNNECTFTKRGQPTENKTYTFRADPKHTQILSDMGVDIVSIANNHTYDYGEISLLDTLDAVDAAGIQRVGAGRNLDEAAHPVYYIVNDIKIAIVAATQIERMSNPDTKGAAESSPGVFRCMEPENLAEAIKQAKANSDFVIAYLHWGTENTTELDWAQKDHSKLYVEAGANLIIGDHPHCLQGITYIEDTPILYSLGNFWFNSKTIDTGIVKISIGKEGLESCQFVPCIQSSFRTTMLSGTEKERVLQDMRSLSPGVLIDVEGYVTRQRR